jgi:hypothetical protein
MIAKFRVWDEKYNCWSKESLLLYPGEEVIRQGRVIQWYTGTDDKTGKEIYQGDIIQGQFDFGPAGFKEHLSVVKWDNDDGYQWNYWDLSTVEVVGNIFELPCSKPKAFDHNGECLTCDAWATDCPFIGCKVK